MRSFRLTAKTYYNSTENEDGPGSLTDIVTDIGAECVLWEGASKEQPTARTFREMGVRFEPEDPSGWEETSYTLEELVDGEWEYCDHIIPPSDDYDDWGDDPQDDLNYDDYSERAWVDHDAQAEAHAIWVESYEDPEEEADDDWRAHDELEYYGNWLNDGPQIRAELELRFEEEQRLEWEASDFADQMMGRLNDLRYDKTLDLEQYRLHCEECEEEERRYQAEKLTWSWWRKAKEFVLDYFHYTLFRMSRFIRNRH